MTDPSPTPLADGLTRVEAARRLEENGPNELEAAQSRSTLAALLDQFRNLLVVVLLVAAVLAGIVGELKDAIVITGVLVLNAVLGFVQERRAEESLAALRSMLVDTTTVRRDGTPTVVPTSSVVPGDVVLVDAGDRMPADGRLLTAHHLEVDESALTGESTPVAKGAGGPTGEVPLAERTGAVFMHTTVTRGRAEVEVTATGMRTEIGRIATLLRDAPAHLTPLQRQLDSLGRRLALVAGVAVVAFIGLELSSGRALGDTLLDAVALAVAAIPEGLPAVVTVTLALGTHQMATRGAIVKRLASVETLGATTVICSDKTGTLTQNRMQAHVVLSRTGTHRIQTDGEVGTGHIEPPPDDDTLAAVRVGLLCNDASITDGELVGDPTEGALVALAMVAGLDPAAERAAHPRLGELPFDSAAKLMATVHAADGDGAGRDGEVVVHVKGALDVLVGLTDLDEQQRANLLALSEESAASGLRVLALASRRLPASEAADLSPDGVRRLLEHLEIVGIVSLGDPPRPEARDAIDRCRRAGIRVVMITGDHATTAGAIADQLGIRGPVLTGTELDGLDDDELRRQLRSGGVVARVAPEHKVRIVEALQAGGEVVAMNGDGVNDAPALKRADIGVAMGITGTEVSKEAADMVLADDNFATIVGAVEQGRTIYRNIVTFVRFQLATNIGAIAAMLAAPLVGLPVPFTAIQLLWVNIIMDGPPAMALGVDPPRPDAMDHPPREPNEAILTGRRLLTLLLTGAVMAAGSLGLLALMRDDRGEEVALTMAFTTFVLFQLCNALATRAERTTVFTRATLRNRYLWLALGVVLVLQVLAVELGPMRSLFGTTDLTLGEWAICAAVASTVVWVNELRLRLVR